MVSNSHIAFCNILLREMEKLFRLALCCGGENNFSTRQNHCHAWKGKYHLQSLETQIWMWICEYEGVKISSKVLILKTTFMKIVYTMSILKGGISPPVQSLHTQNNICWKVFRFCLLTFSFTIRIHDWYQACLKLCPFFSLSIRFW